MRGPVVVALFGLAVQLRDGDDGDLHLARQSLEAPRDGGDLLLAAVNVLRPLHELEIVNHRQPQPLLAP